MKYTNLTCTKSFNKLKEAYNPDSLTALTTQRILNSSIPAGGGLTYNWAAMPIGEDQLKILRELAAEQKLIDSYRRLLAGEIMNTGENRLVLHQLTRGRALGPDCMIFADNEEKGSFYAEQLEAIADFSEKIRCGELLGSTGKAIETVVQIGIGGSDLGPRAIYLALNGWCVGENVKRIQARFISNVDPDDAAEVLKGLDFETTLFILVSKSGTTLETLTNRDLVLKAITESGIQGIQAEKHMVAVTSKTSPLAASSELLDAFYIDDFIGGRYSSTSAVGGVILSLAFGYPVFAEFLSGAHEADILALEDDITKNAALADALIGIYLRNALGLPTTAILPYAQALTRFPAHLQQLDMESNGKHVNREGEPLSYSTGPIIFGEPGTNGQHSFYQLLHQGTDTIPLQFIGFSSSQYGKDMIVENSTSQTKLNANLVAQIVAFAKGKEDANPNKQFEGNRYSSLLFAEKLEPRTLGALLAHFENKVMFQGFAWNLNSFDQEGVQLGKVLATKVLNGCEGDEVLQAYSELF